MMMPITSTMMLIATMKMSSSKNPMKTCLAAMLISTIIFFNMYIKTGLSWFPLIMFMLFTGGILMMFMVVSSVTPNKKMGKSKKMSKMIFVMLCLMMLIISLKAMNKPEDTQMTEMKWFFMTKESMMGTATIMMIYFTAFLTFLSKSNMTLRSTMCH